MDIKQLTEELSMILNELDSGTIIDTVEKRRDNWAKAIADKGYGLTDERRDEMPEKEKFIRSQNLMRNKFSKLNLKIEELPIYKAFVEFASQKGFEKDTIKSFDGEEYQKNLVVRYIRPKTISYSTEQGEKSYPFDAYIWLKVTSDNTYCELGYRIPLANTIVEEYSAYCFDKRLPNDFVSDVETLLSIHDNQEDLNFNLTIDQLRTKGILKS